MEHVSFATKLPLNTPKHFLKLTTRGRSCGCVCLAGRFFFLFAERVSAPGKSSANASPSIRQSENDNDDEARVKGENIVVAEAAPAL